MGGEWDVVEGCFHVQGLEKLGPGQLVQHKLAVHHWVRWELDPAVYFLQVGRKTKFLPRLSLLYQHYTGDEQRVFVLPGHLAQCPQLRLALQIILDPVSFSWRVGDVGLAYWTFIQHLEV